ncbi:hypothetical protein N665_0058s0133 [Sinapis alba]|nr:hypothetical protein N665_0058s0133 [Sinapis alba]
MGLTILIIEQKQSEIIGQLVDRASLCVGISMLGYLVMLYFNWSLFNNALQLEGTTHSVCLDVLRRIPQLSPDQILKLKQLTLLTHAESNKPYDTLMFELDVTNVRQLEDFLIYECMYAGIVRGKLDQLKRCFEVPFSAGRDLSPGTTRGYVTRSLLSNWLNTSENLLGSIQDKLKWADNMSEMDKKHRKEAEGVEEVKRSLSMSRDVDSRGHKEMFGELSGVMDYEEDGIRPKRRRHPKPR